MLLDRENGKLEFTGYKVLLVDDEPAVLSVLEWALQDLGCTVVSALGGRAAMSALTQERFGLIITDLVMPDLDGLSLIRMARKVDPGMRFVIMTGSPELLPGHFGEGNRPDDVMVKPFGLKRLKKTIAKCRGARSGDSRLPAFLTIDHQRFSAEPIKGNDS